MMNIIKNAVEASAVAILNEVLESLIGIRMAIILMVELGRGPVIRNAREIIGRLLELSVFI